MLGKDFFKATNQDNSHHDVDRVKASTMPGVPTHEGEGAAITLDRKNINAGVGTGTNLTMVLKLYQKPALRLHTVML